MTLTLMCGLSFSGKSTLAGRLAQVLPAAVISLDSINEERGLDGGQGIPVEEWAATNRIAHERAGELLEEGRHVVVDDTGSPRFLRDEWRATADRASAPFALVWVQIGHDLQQERVRANRESRSRPDVTDAVLDAHRAGFEAPTDEAAITVDARTTTDPRQVEEIVRRLRASSAR